MNNTPDYEDNLYFEENMIEQKPFYVVVQLRVDNQRICKYPTLEAASAEAERMTQEKQPGLIYVFESTAEYLVQNKFMEK